MINDDVYVDKLSAHRFGITNDEVSLVKNLVEREISRIKSAILYDGFFEVNVIFKDNRSSWGKMRIDKKLSTDKDRVGTMTISKMTVEGAKYGEKLVDTICHELLHLLPGGHNHRGMWQNYANTMNRKYGYHISRSSSAEDFGIPNSVCERKSDVKYMLICTHCGHEYPHKRRTKSVLHPENYMCGVCFHPLTRKF